jgi:hypothetical protein
MWEMRETKYGRAFLLGVARVCEIFALRQGKIVMIQMFLEKVTDQRAGRQGSKGEIKPVARAYGLMYVSIPSLPLEETNKDEGSLS